MLFWRGLLSLWLVGMGFLQSTPAGTAYFVQVGTPAYIANFVQPEAGCSWQGLGGQVFNLRGQPVPGLVIVVRGVLGDRQILEYALTGSSQQFGPGGYDLKLADQLVASQGTLTIELQDITGRLLSQVAAIDTRAQCSQNLTVVNWVEQGRTYYFPYLPRQR